MTSFNVAQVLAIPNLKKHITEVDAKLLEIVPAKGSLKAPIERLVKAPSKRLRSTLVIASTLGKEVDSSVIAGCVAIELVHLASLVHDDIMDEAEVRWGVPTVNNKEGLDQAILVGDYLFAQANLVASTISPEVARTVASTIAELCIGQAKELSDVNNTDRSINSYVEAIAGKTGSLISASCRLGGLISELETRDVDALTDFGKSFGISFQILDDVLDFTSSTELLGKPVRNDIVEGVYTLPVILALQGPHRRKMLSLLENAKNIRDVSATLVIHEGYIRQSTKAVQKYNQRAKETLAKLDSRGLDNLPQAYTDWALSQLVEN